MSLHRLRRWLARHPLAWALGLALVLAGAQTVGAVHELSHGPSLSFAAPSAAPATNTPAPTTDAGWHLGASGDCLTCLAVAALGGAAPAPCIAALVVDPPSTPWTADVAVAFSPRLLRAYASRAPPLPHSA